MDIVKFRWPELLMILVFHACALFLFGDIEVPQTPDEQQQFSGAQFLLGMGVAALGIISQMMLWGFLRTIAVSQAQPIPPGQLLVAGRWYFWKLFAFQININAANDPGGLCAAGCADIVFYGSAAMNNAPAWVQIVSLLTAWVIFLKPFYFVPAVVLAKDISPLESVRAIRLLNLWEMKAFLSIAVVFFVAVGAVESLSGLVHRGDLLYYPLLAVQSIVMSIGVIAIFLSAMLECCGGFPNPPGSKRKAKTMSPDFHGKFIVLDGPDGCGKTTQQKLLSEWIQGCGAEAVCFRDPGTTAIGEQIRTILLDPAHTAMGDNVEVLLYMAARAQLWKECIAQALKTGACVLMDRWLSSTCAYQGRAGGFGVEKVVRIAEESLERVWPDATIILDVDTQTAAARMNRPLDRMEQKGGGYHQRVREGFLELCDHYSGIFKVDATRCAVEVQNHIRVILEGCFGGRAK